ncbi:MAG TPA: cysteine desulfurase family protein, partial [Limnochordia bacterium]
MRRRIYLDHAATTPIHPAVREAMAPYLAAEFGNPSSIHAWGRAARRAVDEARDTVAAALGAASGAEIIFTSGGSEADNLALKGLAFAPWREARRNRIVISSIEHHAVLDTAEFLAAHGFDVVRVRVDGDGLIDLEALSEAVTDRTLVVSVMHANNEVGTIQPVKWVAAIAHRAGALVHTDAVQTVGHLQVDVTSLECDLLALSAHKFYGPKGVGCLYVRRGVRLAPLIHGGGQERERRAGTENVAGIVGLARALELAEADRATEAVRLAALRDRLIAGIEAGLPAARLNGHRSQRLPNNAHFCFPGVQGESLLLNLDLEGIAASSGSACTAGSLEASHVLLAMGLSRELAEGSLRLSLGRGNTEAEIDAAIEAITRIVERLTER